MNVVTVLSRMSRVTREGGDSVSKLDELLQKQGINLIDSNGEFRNRFEVLQEVAAAEENWSSTVSEAIKFELAGTRQKKVLNVVLREMDSILERTTIAMNSQGATMEANDIFAESLAGHMGDFKNSMEELFTTIVSSDALKDLIDFGTDFTDLMLDVQNSVGILNSVLLVTVPLFIALKGEMIAMKLIGLAESIFLIGLHIKDLGISAGLAAVGVSALQVAMAGLAIAIGAVVAISVIHEKNQRELIESTTEATDKLSQYKDEWVNLNQEQQKNAKILAEATIVELGRKFTQAEKDIKETTKGIADLNKSMAPYLEKLKEGEELTANEALALRNYNRELDFLNEKLITAEAIVDTYNLALEVSGDEYVVLTKDFQLYLDKIDEYKNASIDATESTDDFAEAQTRLTQNIETLEDMIKNISKDFEFMSDAKQQETLNFIQSEIDKTRALKEELLDRIELYKQEIAAVSILNSAVTGAEDEFVKIRLKNIEFLQKEVEELVITSNKLQRAWDDLNETEKKRADALKAAEDAERERLEALKAQKKALDELNDAYKDSSEIIAKNVRDALEKEIKLREEVLEKSIKLQQDLIDEIKEDIELKEKAIEEEIKLQEQVIDNKEDAIDAIDNEIDAMKKRNDALEEQAKRQQIVLDLEKAIQDLASIEDDALLFDPTSGAFGFGKDPRVVAEAQKKISDLQESLTKHDADVAKEMDIKKLQDKKDALEQEKELLEKAKDDFEDMEEEKVEAIEETLDAAEEALKDFKDIEQEKIDASKDALSEISDITSAELGSQNAMWQTWADKNKEILTGLAPRVNSMISALGRLQKNRLANIETSETLGEMIDPTSNIDVSDINAGVGGSIENLSENPNIIPIGGSSDLLGAGQGSTLSSSVAGTTSKTLDNAKNLTSNNQTTTSNDININNVIVKANDANQLGKELEGIRTSNPTRHSDR